MGTQVRGGHARARIVAPTIVAGLAAGGVLMLSSVLFLVPFLVSDRARQNDVFMSNLFLGPPFWLVGSTLLLVSLARLGLGRVLTAALALANPALVALVLAWSQGALGGIAGTAAVLMADAGAVVVASALVYVLLGGR